MLIALFLAGMLLVPSGANSGAPAQNAVPEAKDVTALSSSYISHGISRTVRVAIYNEPNITEPSYTTNGGTPHNNVTLLKSILQSYGIEATSLNVHDISMHKLRTADFDVFAMPDNLPRENITNLVKDFWLGGGGILAFDGSALSLCYMGILPPESLGSDGYATYWGYVGGDVNITTRHPVSQSYPLGNVTPTGSGYFVWKWSALSGSSIAADLTKVARAGFSPDYVSVLAFNPSTQGGRVVTILTDLVNDYIPKLHRMYADAADWLCPRPKARILYDLTHVPWYGIDSWDAPLVHIANAKYYVWRDELVSRSYTVDKLYRSPTGNLTLANLAPYDVLVEAAPSLNFTASEVTAVSSWIAAGGSLLAMGDNPGVGDPNKNINYLLSPHNLEMSLTTGGSGGIYNVFEKHPVSEACGAISPSGPGRLNFVGAAYPIVGDTFGNWILGGQVQGNGRILLQADLNIFAYEYIASNDNRQYSMNIINWLASGGAGVLLYVDEPYSPNYYRTPVADALNDLQVPFYLTFTGTYMNLSLYLRNWWLVIVDNPWYDVDPYLTVFAQQIVSGSRFLMSSYRVGNVPLNPLWAYLGFAYASPQPDSNPLYIWQKPNSVFNIPNKYGAANFTPTYDYGGEGDLLHVFGNATALAGSTAAATVNKTNIVVRNDGRTLYNGYLIDEFWGDTDNSAYKDNFELWENEIAFMLRPTIDSPVDVQYVSGTTGNTIVWHPSSYNPFNYSLTINGTDAGHGPWAGPSISLNVDGLAVGYHTCMVEVWDVAGYSCFDTVLVRVLASTTTTTTTSAPPFPLTTIALIAAAAVVILLLLVLLKKRGKR